MKIRDVSTEKIVKIKRQAVLKNSPLSLIDHNECTYSCSVGTGGG